MFKFSLTLAMILSSLYVSFSQAQGTLSACATNCSETIGGQVGCNSYQLNLPNCVCLNAQFYPSALVCVSESCTSDELTTASDFWLGVCKAYESSLSASTATSSSGYGGLPSSQPTGSASSGSATSTGYVFPSSTTTKGPPYGASSVSVSGSGPSSSSTSNLAATMPTHAAALIAGGIGAVVAVFV